MKIIIEDDDNQIKYTIQGTLQVPATFNKKQVLALVSDKLSEFDETMHKSLMELSGFTVESQLKLGG
jgi:hypothetical protein